MAMQCRGAAPDLPATSEGGLNFDCGPLRMVIPTGANGIAQNFRRRVAYSAQQQHSDYGSPMNSRSRVITRPGSSLWGP